MCKFPHLLKNDTSFQNTYIYLSFLVFKDKQAEDNLTTVERFVEDPCQSSPTPVVNKKRMTKKLVFPGPTIQNPEEDDPNITSNQMERDSEVELAPQQGKEREKSLVEQNTHKEVPYPKGKSQKCL
ncbi:hypothetical protein O181_100063 [Austropuccinia psidii MF-1]|uniref:Uncharacterized protein n=1 Tax=Austropuccinia psidii MF-1 TaxID=1389203 RepID=A0A9Q3JC18_9BASI|nr:hypothetical protein [Austropuccinia psidii MF-1]